MEILLQSLRESATHNPCLLLILDEFLAGVLGEQF